MGKGLRKFDLEIVMIRVRSLNATVKVSSGKHPKDGSDWNVRKGIVVFMDRARITG